MLVYWSILLFSCWLHHAFGNQVASVCRAINISCGIIDHRNHNIKVYSNNYIVNINPNLENSTYSNTLTITNFHEWFFNISSYYRSSPIGFNYPYRFDTHYTNCSSENDSCTFNFPNGQLVPSFLFEYRNQKNISIYNNIETYLNDGIFFGGNDKLNGDRDGCFVQNEGIYTDEITWTHSACCIKFENIDIPDSNKDICQGFEAKATIYDNILNTTIFFNAHTSVLYNIYYTDLFHNVTEFTSTNYNYSYLYPSFNYVQGDCEGNNSAPISTCGNEWNLKEDFGKEFFLSLDNYSPREKYYGIQVGELIRLNGTFIKNGNQPYTKVDPCYKKSANVPFKNATYESSFCCTKFQDDPNASTPAPSDSRTDAFGTLCSNDTSKAWLDIVFAIDVSSAILINLMKPFNISQNGNHTTRIALITFATDVVIQYSLSNITNYSELKEAFAKLPSYSKPNDSGVSAGSAIIKADDLVRNNSYRASVIFFIAAGYDKNGFANLPHNVDATFMTISFAPENSTAQWKINAISSKKFSFNSMTLDLYSKVSYELTQINCFCPINTRQFYGSSTYYAECYYGSTRYIIPSQELCSPGILVTINSEKKFDDIFTLINNEFYSVKNFTIGFHKSLDENQWKWWDFDESEYPVGEYPAFYRTPEPNDNFGYMSRYFGYNWRLETGYNVALPFLCQIRACDASYICDQTF